MNIYPRETKELIVVIVFDGTTSVTDFEVSITGHRDRPITWSAPDLAGDKRGVLIDHLPPGTYRIWARVTANPEAPVVDCGPVAIS